MSHTGNCFEILFTLIIIKLHTKTPMGPGCALLISGSKGQGHNALIIENGFFVHNRFPFTSAIIKLHTQILSESRICPNAIGEKKSC